MYAGRVYVHTKRTGAAARDSLRQDRPARSRRLRFTLAVAQLLFAHACRAVDTAATTAADIRHLYRYFEPERAHTQARIWGKHGESVVHTRCIRKVASQRKQWLNRRACRGFQQLAKHAASRPDVHTKVIHAVKVQRELRRAAVTSQAAVD